MTAWPAIQLFFISAGAAIGYYVGGFDGFFTTLVVFVVLDYITALALAIKEKRLSSDVGFFGIFRKLLIFAMVAVANIIDNEIVGTGDMLRNAVVFFYLSNEGLSLLENYAALGLRIPECIRDVLANLRDGKDTPAKARVISVELEVHPEVVEELTAPEMIDELTDGRGEADGVHE